MAEGGVTLAKPYHHLPSIAIAVVYKWWFRASTEHWSVHKTPIQGGAPYGEARATREKRQSAVKGRGGMIAWEILVIREVASLRQSINFLQEVGAFYAFVEAEKHKNSSYERFSSC